MKNALRMATKIFFVAALAVALLPVFPNEASAEESVREKGTAKISVEKVTVDGYVDETRIRGFLQYYSGKIIQWIERAGLSPGAVIKLNWGVCSSGHVGWAEVSVDGNAKGELQQCLADFIKKCDFARVDESPYNQGWASVEIKVQGV
ncbi:MAG: hypothetical protein AB9866_05540 [Syntrophobacteraceae bacterium]